VKLPELTMPDPGQNMAIGLVSAYVADTVMFDPRLLCDAAGNWELPEGHELTGLHVIVPLLSVSFIVVDEGFRAIAWVSKYVATVARLTVHEFPFAEHVAPWSAA
jgi:hypothetical protein